ncbi:MAG: hypothetical protein P3W97_004000 [Tepidimonas sp.]|nr:hypothetical protein [Tepidimonas sp.]
MLSLMLAGAVALAMQLLQRASDAQAREALTLQRIERIRGALCAYHLIHNGFPDLPGRNPPTSTPLIEPANLPPGHLPPVGWANPGGAPSASLRRLGLSPDDVTDGWGRLISVRLSAACPAAADPLAVDQNGDGSGDVANACVVLISHGRTGRGAALPQASPAANNLVWLPAPLAGSSPTAGEGAEWRNTRRTASPYQTVAPQCASDRTNPDSPCHYDDVVAWFDALSGGGKALCR